MQDFPVVGVQLVVKMSLESREADVQAVVNSFHQIVRAMRFTAAAVLPVGVDYRVEVSEV